MKISKNIARTVFAMLFAVALIAGACSSNGDSGSDDSGGSIIAASQVSTASAVAVSSTTISPVSQEAIGVLSVVLPFSAANGSGSVAVSGDNSPVVAWFGGLPGEVSLDLADADVNDAASVVEELVSFWFFQDDDSGDVPPNVYVSASGDITDSVGTRYVVEAQGLPPAPVAETTTTTSTSSTTSSTTSSAPETSEPPSSATSSTTTSTSSTTTTTTTVVESPAVLQVQVLNGSGVAGAAGRMTDKLSQAGYVVLSPENAPQRYSSSAVYYQEGWKGRAEEILQAAEIEEIDAPTAMPQQFATEEAAVIVLLGTDTAPAVAREQAGLRPRQRNNVALPLADSVPRDRFVPGLADIQIFSRVNDEQEYIGQLIHTLQGWIGQVGNYAPDYIFGVSPSQRESREDLETGYRIIEEILEELGFTPQNVCGAPSGYSFRDLLQPTREWNANTRTYSGDAIFTTDRLIELHGGPRINPEENLDFYIQQAVQASYDTLRSAELLSETESMQLILCEALVSPSGEIPEYANSLWYANLTPGIQPRESLLSQGTYHVKEISRNGSIAYVLVCHPTLGEQNILLHWREAGYRAEVVGSRRNFGCQESFERETYIWEDTNGVEDTFYYAFGEKVFSGADMDSFPRG